MYAYLSFCIQVIFIIEALCLSNIPQVTLDIAYRLTNSTLQGMSKDILEKTGLLNDSVLFEGPNKRSFLSSSFSDESNQNPKNHNFLNQKLQQDDEISCTSSNEAAESGNNRDPFDIDVQNIRSGHKTTQSENPKDSTTRDWAKNEKPPKPRRAMSSIRGGFKALNDAVSLQEQSSKPSLHILADEGLDDISVITEESNLEKEINLSLDDSILLGESSISEKEQSVSKKVYGTSQNNSDTMNKVSRPSKQVDCDSPKVQEVSLTKSRLNSGNRSFSMRALLIFICVIVCGLLCLLFLQNVLSTKTYARDIVYFIESLYVIFLMLDILIYS